MTPKWPASASGSWRVPPPASVTVSAGNWSPGLSSANGNLRLVCGWQRAGSRCQPRPSGGLAAGGRAAGSAEGGEYGANVVRVHAGGVVRRHVPGPDDAGTVDDEGGGDGQVPAAVGGVGG